MKYFSTDQDRRDGLEAIQADMAEHQRSILGQEVTAEANRALAAETFQQLENQGVFAPPRDEHPNPLPPIETVKETRTVDGREYTFTKEPDKPGAVVPLMARERELVVKALKRLHTLLLLQDDGIAGAPSWSNRAKAVMAIGMTNELRFAQELDELLEASNRYFGDWKIDPDRKVIVGA